MIQALLFQVLRDLHYNYETQKSLIDCKQDQQALASKLFESHCELLGAIESVCNYECNLERQTKRGLNQ